MKTNIDLIPGYAYGTVEVATSPVSTHDLENLKISAGFTDEDERYLRLAGEVLGEQAEQIVHLGAMALSRAFQTLRGIRTLLMET
jgi:hypothetical protein